MFSRDKIIEALGKVIHPEKKKDIVTLGLIEEVESDSDGIIITIAPERSNDPFVTSLKSSVTRVLKEELGRDAVIKEIRVKPKVMVENQAEKPDISP